MSRRIHKSHYPASVGLVLVLSACGSGGGGGLASNGLPYADASVSMTTEVLRSGERIDTVLKSVDGATETAQALPVRITRIDDTHLVIEVNGASHEMVVDDADPRKYRDVANFDAVVEFGGGYADAVASSNFRLPDANGQAVVGYLTDPADMPLNGSLFYGGTAQVSGYDGDVFTSDVWNVALLANFDDSNVTGQIDADGTLIDIASTPFTPAGFDAAMSGPGGIDGQMQGRFYGDAGHAIGGELDLTYPGGVLSGIFMAGHE